MMISSTNLIIEKNVPLAYYVTNKWIGKTRNYDETLSCCFMGLVKAANAFDENRGFSFATFSTKCMENEILMFLRKQNKVYKHEELFCGFKQIRENGDEFDVTEAVLNKDRLNNNIDDWVENEIMKINLRNVLSKLKPKERQILIEYANGSRQNVIAHRYGLSQSYISRIIRSCRDKY